MKRPIPAPGYVTISGRNRPPKDWGDELWCQIRNGICDMQAPWSVSTTRWIHDGSNGDVVAVKAVNGAGVRNDGRQTNGSFE